MVEDERGRTKKTDTAPLEWQRTFSPYGKAIKEFAKEKGVPVNKWYHDSPAWHIGKSQKPEDLNTMWWSLQLSYDEEQEQFGLNAVAWKDTGYETPQGTVWERKLVSGEKALIAKWRKGEKVPMKKLMEQAFDRANSFTDEDLTEASSFVRGKDGVSRTYK